MTPGSVEPVAPKPAPKPACANITNCVVDPCKTALCPNFPNASCVSNYCGGCNADFYDVTGTLIANCTGMFTSSTLLPYDKRFVVFHKGASIHIWYSIILSSQCSQPCRRVQHTYGLQRVRECLHSNVLRHRPFVHRAVCR